MLTGSVAEGIVRNAPGPVRTVRAAPSVERVVREE